MRPHRHIMYLLLGEPPPKRNHNINKEHPMDWIVWAIIGLLFFAIVAGIIGGIVYLIIRAVRRSTQRNGTPPNG